MCFTQAETCISVSSPGLYVSSNSIAQLVFLSLNPNNLLLKLTPSNLLHMQLIQLHLFEATDKSEGKHTMSTNLVHFLRARAGLMHKHYWPLVDPLSEVNNLDLI